MFIVRRPVAPLFRKKLSLSAVSDMDGLLMLMISFTSLVVAVIMLH